MQSFDYIIIGGGPTGLAHAWELEQAGKRVLILERGTAVGGAVKSVRDNGFLMDLGANTLQVSSDAVEQWLVRVMGGPDRLQRANPVSRKRFILCGGKPEPVPMSMGQFIRTPLFSAGAKLRLLSEPFRRAGTGDDESLTSFFSRRFGKGIIDYGLNPVIAGIHAGAPDKLSVQLAFPKLKQWEREYGSVVRGALKSRRDKSPRFRSYSVNFEHGLATLMDVIAACLRTPPVCNCTLQSFTNGGGGWVADYEASGVRTQAKASNLLIACPAHAVPDLPLPDTLASRLAFLRKIEYPSVSVLGLGYRHSDVSHPLDGFGVLVPECEHLPILGTLFTSSIFRNRAPDDHVLLTTFIGGTRQPELPQLPEDRQIALAKAAVEKVLGIRGTPGFVRLHVWKRAIPQRTLGCDAILRQLSAIEAEFSGLHFIGNYRTGISLTNCIEAAMDFTRRHFARGK